MTKRLLLCITLGFGIFAEPSAGQNVRPFVESDAQAETERSIQTTDNCESLERMLKKNGFAVTAAQFPQMFSAYIPSSGFVSRQLPPFITTDSAWHTYHVLLEKGVKQLEHRQAVRLKKFSQRLLSRATRLAGGGQADFSKIVDYASIALALQDRTHAATLTGKQKQLLTALKKAHGKVRGPVGFSLLAPVFRANSFYTSSPRLADYFTARQWYALVVFPLISKEDTSLALRLAMLIDSDKQLGELWRSLSEPYDSLLGETEDGDVVAYASAVRKIVGPRATPAQAAKSVEALQKHLQIALPDPQVNDQLLLTPERFAELTKGFRLLPPRRLTSSVCFQKTGSSSGVSGLHFMVASKQMRSDAAARALKQHSGVKETIRTLGTDPGPLPDSLHGRAMKLIATLQKPPDANAPQALKTKAWSDKQLWTQLGAWAQQRHTWALHAKLTSYGLCSSGRGDAGMVSPYPKFFESLGVLTRQTAKVLARTGAVNASNAESAARDLLVHLQAYEWYAKLPNKFELTSEQIKRIADLKPELDRMAEFINERVDGGDGLFKLADAPTADSLLSELTQTARRSLKARTVTKKDMDILTAFAQSDGQVVERMGEFAAVCDTLGSIARQQLAGKKLNDRDNGFLLSYGPILARCSFYEGDSWSDARDDSPVISPIFVNPALGFTIYSALGRPAELLVMGKLNGQAALMRGAVLSYREFARPLSEPMDDQAWRKIVRRGTSVPQPPAFTKSFIVRPDDEEVIELLGKGKVYHNIGAMTGRKITQTLIQMLAKTKGADRRMIIDHLRHRCGAEDAGVLIKLMRDSYDSSEPEGYFDSFSEMMELAARTPCKTQVAELMRMLTGRNPRHAYAAAYILSNQPALIDSTTLTSQYRKLPTYRRTLYCTVLGHLSKPDKAARDIMLDALNDRDACVRWQGAAALGRSGAKDQTVVQSLTERINDPNSYVGGEALRSLQKLKALPSSETLVEALKQRCRGDKQSKLIRFARNAVKTPWQEWVFFVPETGLFDPGLSGFMKLQQYDERENDKPIMIRPIPADELIVNILVELKYKPAAPVILEILARNGFAAPDTGFYGLQELNGENYLQQLTTLALNRKITPECRAAAIARISHSRMSKSFRLRLAGLLDDKTPVAVGSKTAARTIGELAVLAIAQEHYVNSDIRTTPVYDGDEYRDSFETLEKTVRQWLAATTRPADVKKLQEKT